MWKNDDRAEGAVPVAGSVTVATKSGKSPERELKSESVMLATESISGPHAEVSFEAGVTLNLGYYEMARVGVSIRYPCAPAEVAQVYERAKAWVTERLQAEIQDIRAPKKDPTTPY
jgi:hypothetical protein